MPWASMKKKVLQNIYPIFQSESPVFLWLHRRRLLTLGCWRVFTGYSHIFMAYSRVFDRLAKPVLPPKAGFQCQNRFFWVFAQKPGFCPATHSVSGDGSHIGIYIYLYIYISISSTPQFCWQTLQFLQPMVQPMVQSPRQASRTGSKMLDAKPHNGCIGRMVFHSQPYPILSKQLMYCSMIVSIFSLYWYVLYVRWQ